MTAQRDLEPYGVQATTTLRLCFATNDPPMNRVVFNIAGPESVSIAVMDTGVLIFDFSHSVSHSGGAVSEYKLDHGNNVPTIAQKQIQARNNIRDRRAIYVNAFLSCFNSVIQSNRLTPPMTQENYILVRASDRGMELHCATSPALLHPISYMVEPVSHEMLAEVMRLSIEAYLRAPDIFYDLLEMLYRAAFQCTQHDFQGSLVLSWVVIEKAQNALWKNFITTGYKNVNPNTNIGGHRRDILLTDHNYTAAIKSQILSLSGLYNDQELKSIDDVRKARNKLMHNLSRVDLIGAMNATTCAMSMASKVLGERIYFQVSPTSWDKL